jgi:hypothetical protein
VTLGGRQPAKKIPGKKSGNFLLGNLYVIKCHTLSLQVSKNARSKLNIILDIKGLNRSVAAAAPRREMRTFGRPAVV